MGQYDKDHLPFCDDGDYDDDDDDVDDEKYLPAFLVSETNCLQISVEESEVHSWGKDDSDDGDNEEDEQSTCVINRPLRVVVFDFESSSSRVVVKSLSIE